MAKKPTHLVYGVGDRPPIAASVLLGLQHVVVLTSGWVLVVVIVGAIGATQDEIGNVLRMSMIASGIATILQSIRNTALGSGFLCPIGTGPAYVSASILAGRIGGLSAVFTMTLLAGLFQGLLARIMPRLRPLFPPEVTGLVAAMVGVELVVIACPRFLGVEDGGAGAQALPTVVGALTLATMIGPTVWSRSRLRLYPVLIGLIVGYVLAFSLGVQPAAAWQEALAVPMVSLPQRATLGWSFDLELLPAFLIAAFASTLKSVGDLTLCQKINDADWKRTDMRSVSGGISAGGIGTALSGLLGGIGQTTFSSNVGLSAATGATSRSLAIPCGVILVLLAFSPKLAALFAAMPNPVMGAILVYVACYMILAGLEVLTSRMLDARRIFVVGIALIFGLSVDMVPGLYEDVPEMLEPLFSSSLAVATVLVVALNLLMRIGITQRKVLVLTPGVDGSQRIFEWLEAQGAAWGARRDVIMQATAALNELMESVVGAGLAKGNVEVHVSFDEFNLDVDVRYEGEMLRLAASRPSQESLLTDQNAALDLAGYLIRQYADRVDAEEIDGRCRIRMHFDH